ncbi:hypothetical protein AMATHDRAFT_49519 [Amanita thiersii Skay4041]|uniref:FAD-binding domain-containing protein n=1 Tax=Amanita thiersii Skay4041 TaxID=703135 RepID=A0A2A9NJI7_9AGAR|nr:hypothetical protein AMATHDRAFT_49519 [Amanita thiersii Skay4041]
MNSGTPTQRSRQPVRIAIVLSTGSYCSARSKLYADMYRGLTLARVFSRFDGNKCIKVTIYDSAPEFSEVGAGISLRPRTWEIFKDLGLEPALNDVICAYDGETTPTYLFRRADQRVGVTFYEPHFDALTGTVSTLHRADLQRVLLDHLLPSMDVHLSHRLISYSEEQPGKPITLEFENGKKAACDILIGADGIHSVVRQHFLRRLAKQNVKDGVDYEASIDPQWTGTMLYRGLVLSEELRRKVPDHRSLIRPMIYCGKNKHIVTYPISRDKYVNVVCFDTDPLKEGTPFKSPSAVEQVTADRVRKVYKDWEDEIQFLLECIDKPLMWPLLDIQPLSTYAQGRVVLLGDAAHAMRPHLASGAGQAIEDAYIAGYVLAQAAQHGFPLEEATKIYSDVRQPVGNKFLSASRAQGFLYDLNSPDLGGANGNVAQERLEEVGLRIGTGWDLVWKTSSASEIKKAREMTDVAIVDSRFTHL